MISLLFINWKKEADEGPQWHWPKGALSKIPENLRHIHSICTPLHCKSMQIHTLNYEKLTFLLWSQFASFPAWEAAKTWQKSVLAPPFLRVMQEHSPQGIPILTWKSTSLRPTRLRYLQRAVVGIHSVKEPHCSVWAFLKCTELLILGWLTEIYMVVDTSLLIVVISVYYSILISRMFQNLHWFMSSHDLIRFSLFFL